jgi:putative DNA primase/helicase
MSHKAKTPAALAGATGASKHSQTLRHQYTNILQQLEDFRFHIRTEYGLDLIGDFKADGHFHGLRSTDDRRGYTGFRYCVHLDDPQNIYFIDLKRGFSGTWFPQGQEPLSPAEREQLRRDAEARRVQREAEVYERHKKAAAWARKLWRRTIWASAQHPYLLRKRVGIHGIRLLPIWERSVQRDDGSYEWLRVEGVLLVPMRDETGVLWNVQAIFPEVCPALGRNKDFLPGGRKKGLFHWIGERTDTVCLAEGYATAATIHEETGYRCIVAFDAGNLPLVAQIVRAMLPAARIVVCADHDLPDKCGRQAGLAFATEAAARVDGFVAVPPVEGADFNDWADMLKGGGHGG